MKLLSRPKAAITEPFTFELLPSERKKAVELARTLNEILPKGQVHYCTTQLIDNKVVESYEQRDEIVALRGPILTWSGDTADSPYSLRFPIRMVGELHIIAAERPFAPTLFVDASKVVIREPFIVRNKQSNDYVEAECYHTLVAV